MLFTAKRFPKKIEVYRDGKLIDVRNTKVPYTHVVVYFDSNKNTQGPVTYTKALKNAEKHNWWLQGYDFKKYIAEIEEDNKTEDLQEQMGKAFLPPAGFRF